MTLRQCPLEVGGHPGNWQASLLTPAWNPRTTVYVRARAEQLADADRNFLQRFDAVIDDDVTVRCLGYERWCNRIICLFKFHSFGVGGDGHTSRWAIESTECPSIKTSSRTCSVMRWLHFRFHRPNKYA